MNPTWNTCILLVFSTPLKNHPRIVGRGLAVATTRDSRMRAQYDAVEVIHLKGRGHTPTCRGECRGWGGGRGGGTYWRVYYHSNPHIQPRLDFRSSVCTETLFGVSGCMTPTGTTGWSFWGWWSTQILIPRIIIIPFFLCLPLLGIYEFSSYHWDIYFALLFRWRINFKNIA